ncbi:ABC transporter substrate-binding protein [Aliarcobacter lanthieri]|uniref:ABC transporter substrate-binding protein n=1 Tax=Aliarcobacter lanthieri TaxID=1355374 RepID=UPI00047C999E|nr:helical backbone metal receptor [Aliarcobacter lanthieri]QKF59319.1 iron siderophore ABC transporter, periplasmic substrate-binding protein [Aliarcobacter lanthieri]
MKKLLLSFLFCTYLLSYERIITLSPSVNEIVYALDLGYKVVANTEFCDYPQESKKVQKVGGYGNVSLEKVVLLNPDIIITHDFDEKLNKNLEKLGFELKVYSTKTMKDIQYTITDLGEVFEQKKKANELNNKINEALNSLKNIVTNQKILIVISPQNTLSNQIYVAGNYVYFEDIIKQSQNENAYFSNSKAQPVLNTEKIIKLNPDIIVLLSPFLEDKKNEEEKIIKLWETLPINASKNKNIYSISKEYAGIPSNRVEYFIEDFKKILEDVRDKKLQ